MKRNRQSAAKDILEGEEWRPIPGWEGLYEASNLGRIYSVTQRKILKQSIKDNRKEYLKVSLNLKKKYDIRVHRLIAMTFIPNPENKPIVNHKDLNQKNNRADNLEWRTNDENLKHAAEHGVFKGRRFYHRKIYILTHKSGEVCYFIGRKAIAEKFGYKDGSCGRMNEFVNTGEYVNFGLLDGWKIDCEDISVQRLSELFGVDSSESKLNASQKKYWDEDIVSSLTRVNAVEKTVGK